MNLVTSTLQPWVTNGLTKFCLTISWYLRLHLSMGVYCIRKWLVSLTSNPWSFIPVTVTPSTGSWWPWISGRKSFWGELQTIFRVSCFMSQVGIAKTTPVWRYKSLRIATVAFPHRLTRQTVKILWKGNGESAWNRAMMVPTDIHSTSSHNKPICLMAQAICFCKILPNILLETMEELNRKSNIWKTNLNLKIFHNQLEAQQYGSFHKWWNWLLNLQGLLY